MAFYWKKNKKPHTYRIVNGNVAFQSDGHRHKDGPAHGHALDGVQEVGEDHGVDVGAEAEVPAEVLQDGPEQVPAVKADQGHQEHVERVAHVIPETG